MRRGVITGLLVQLHRLHRWSGTAMALLMALWFASGAVMTFASYPAYTDAERLARALPLRASLPPLEPSDAAALSAAGETVPPGLIEWLRAGGLTGGTARLMMLEGEPRWLLQGAERYEALRTEAPWQLSPLDPERVRAEAKRTHGACLGESSTVYEADQWTVGRSHPGSYPLQHIACNDASGLELYVSTRSGEIVQQSTRSERVLAWLGPIPHWIYPAVLRRERAVWRDVVLWLSGIGWLVTVSGMLAGAHAALHARRSSQRQVFLRWHQRLGLAFGLFASSWIFSGALSLEPFHWATSAHDGEQARAWSVVAPSARLPQQLAAALAHCQQALPDLRELELVALGKLYAVCSDASARTRIVDLEDPLLTVQERIPSMQLQQLVAAISPAAQVILRNEPDDYYYPTHRQPIARPYARIALHDSVDTVLYVDPARGQLVQQMDERKRLERWLYHGLHSWDFPALYTHPVLWRAVVISAMAIGSALATLGALIVVRRWRRRFSDRVRS
jgi:hypothetical protein